MKPKFPYATRGIKVDWSYKCNGRGVFATQSFKEGDIIEAAPSIKITTNAAVLDYTNLSDYIFTHDTKDDGCSYIGLGYTSLYNHSFDPEAEFSVMDTLIIITAIKDIKKGSEIYVHYGWDDEVFTSMGIV